MHILLIVIAILSAGAITLMFANESRQIVGQRTYERADRRFFVAIGLLVIFLSFYLPFGLEDGYYQLIIVPGIFLILYGTRKISLSYHGVFNGILFVTWHEIESVRRDRVKKNRFTMKVKKRTVKNFFLDRFVIHVCKRYADDVNDAMIRNLP